MLKALRDMALSTRLLLLPSLFVAAMLICAAAAHSTLSEAKVHGPYYARVVEQKDLIADVLPPPLYVVETYLTALAARSAASPLERARLAEQVRAQREVYDERLATWRAQLPKGELRDALLERSRKPAQAFFDALERDYLPAVLAGEGARADAIQSARLAPLYAEHRAAIDRVVALATRASSDTEAEVRTIIAQAGERDLWLAAVLIAIVVAVSLWLRKAALEGAAREAEAAARLRETLGAIAACGEVLTRSAQALSGIGEQLSAHAESTSHGSQGASASSDQVSNTLQTVAAGAEEYSASIREISRHAQDAASVAGTAVSATGAAQETVASLGTRSAEVGDVVAQINTIAQQTNLLALNAAIEAARAGEAGKGFAVVAHDVKELARATSQATRDIGRKILAMQGEAQRAVGVLADIHGIVNRINDHQQTIASAVEEQTATTSEISRSVSEGARGTREIAAVLGGVAHTADATRDAAVRARATADELVRMGRELNALVARCAGGTSDGGTDSELEESGVRDRRALGHAARRRAA